MPWTSLRSRDSASERTWPVVFTVRMRSPSRASSATTGRLTRDSALAAAVACATDDVESAAFEDFEVALDLEPVESAFEVPLAASPFEQAAIAAARVSARRARRGF